MRHKNLSKMFVLNGFFIAVTTAFCFFARGGEGHAMKSLKTVGPPVDDVMVRFPYVVGLTSLARRNQNTTVCTGTLVTSIFVLSSTSCTLRLQMDELKVYRKLATHELEYRSVLNVYIHPMYGMLKSLGHPLLVKLEKPFQHFPVGQYVRFTPKLLKSDTDVDCMIIGIGLPNERSYAVPVRAKYGPTACHIPESDSDLKNQIGYTWTEFLCTRTLMDASSQTSPHLPCDRADALVCNGNQQHGILAYGYETTALAKGYANECGNVAVQNRHLYVNSKVRWIQDIVTIHTMDTDDEPAGQSAVTARVTVEKTKPVRESPVTARATAETTKSDGIKRLSSQSPSSKSPVSSPSTFGNDGGVIKPLLDDHPYLVYVEGENSDEPSCGGTLITPALVLTSAYCTVRMSSIKVSLLDGSGLSTSAHQLYVHENFNLKTLTADISVIVLQVSFAIAKYARLPDAINDTTLQDPFSGGTLKNCSVMAKRPKTSDHNIPLNIKYGVGACRKASDLEIQRTVSGTWQEFFCGRPKSRLKYDIGSPLICNGVQYGISSHSYQILRDNGRKAEEKRFLSVQNYLKWLDQIVTMVSDPDYEISRSRRSCGELAIVLLSWLMLQLVY